MHAIRAVGASSEAPVCKQCRASGRYCDRTEKPTTFVQYEHIAPADNDPPRSQVKDPSIARLFHAYITDISPWYDLSDPAQSFGNAVPSIALDEPLLFHAVIALAAMHACKTSTEGGALLAQAQRHHATCVGLLIALDGEDEPVRRGVALVATCLLRSYEILGGDTDPNLHLRGAYSMASLRPSLNPDGDHTLAEAGFWNYLREDITFSLYERCPLKMDLQQTRHVHEYRSDEDYLNLLTMSLGRVINATFVPRIVPSQWVSCLEFVKWCFGLYPRHMLPFARTPASDSSPLPVIWFIRPCHAAAMHYYLVALVILVCTAPKEQAHLLTELDFTGLYDPSEADLLNVLAMEISGIAFTAKTPSVIVNAFGPMSYCCRFLRNEPSRDELERQLSACKKTTGWPVQRLLDGLKSFWAR